MVNQVVNWGPLTPALMSRDPELLATSLAYGGLFPIALQDEWIGVRINKVHAVSEIQERRQFEFEGVVEFKGPRTRMLGMMFVDENVACTVRMEAS